MTLSPRTRPPHRTRRLLASFAAVAACFGMCLAAADLLAQGAGSPPPSSPAGAPGAAARGAQASAWPLPPLKTAKPPLHARHWLAITGKPLGATAGAMMFQKGGNAVDAAAAMLAATCTMWDTLSCGGETQALIYDPREKKVVGINALGVAPTGATPEFFLNLPEAKKSNLKYAPADG